jgi:hypothetical protein
MGWYKLLNCLVLLVWFSEFKIKRFLFLTTKSTSEMIYWDTKGRISSLLNGFLHETLLLQPTIIQCFPVSSKCSSLHSALFFASFCWIKQYMCSHFSLASFFIKTVQSSLQHPYLPIFSSSSPLLYFFSGNLTSLFFYLPGNNTGLTP